MSKFLSIPNINDLYSLPTTSGSSGQVLTKGSGTSTTWSTPTSGLGGSGTVNAIPKFTATNTLGNSSISDSGSIVTFSNATKNYTSTGSHYWNLYGSLNLLGITDVAQDLFFGSESVRLKSIVHNSQTHQWKNGATNLAVLSSTGALRLHSYGEGYAVFDSNGNITSTGSLDISGGPYLPLSAGSTTPLTGDLISDSSIGLGISIPTSDIHIYGAASTAPTKQIRISSYSTNGFGGTSKLHLDTTAYGTSTIGFGPAGIGGDASTAAGRIIYTDVNDDLAFFTNNSEKMRLSGDGELGIGLTDPSEKLEVNGNVKADKYINQRVTWNAGFLATNNVSTSFNYIPVGYITESTAASYYHSWISAYSGRVRRIVMRGTDNGSSSNVTTNQFRVLVNNIEVYLGSVQNVAGVGTQKLVALTLDDEDALFGANSNVQVQYKANGNWQNVAVSITLEYTN
jgi:hypothetical protein